MQIEIINKRNEFQKKLELRRKEMAKFFKCDDSLIKFSEPVYFNNKSKVKVKFTCKNKVLNNKNWVITEKYYFDFEAEYLKREGLWYYGNFYYLNDLSKFFQSISLQIENFNQQNFNS